MSRFLTGLVALIFSISPATSTVAELPSNYRQWPVAYATHKGKVVTFRSSNETNAQVVRVVLDELELDTGQVINYLLIGYSPQSNPEPKKILLKSIQDFRKSIRIAMF